jgi:hypothetical protein
MHFHTCMLIIVKGGEKTSKQKTTTLIILTALTVVMLCGSASATDSTNTTLITTSSGNGGNNNSYDPVISADGNIIAYQSTATDLILGTTTTGKSNIYYYDKTTGKTVLVTNGTSGTGGDWDSIEPSISADGNLIAFCSLATNLIPGEPTPGHYKIFLYNRLTGETSLISKLTADSDSYYPSISGDGALIAYESYATNMGAANAPTTNSNANIYFYSRVLDFTILVTTGASGNGGNSYSIYPSLSSDGKWLTFTSKATDLTGNTVNSNRNVYIYDMIKRIAPVLITTGDSNIGGNFDSELSTISADGNLITFQSKATNLINGFTTINQNIFLYNRTSGAISLITKGTNALHNGGDGGSYEPTISGDGNVIAFKSFATNLIPDLITHNANVFIYDQSTGITQLVTTGASGTGGDHNSEDLALTPDGEQLVFYSWATDLIHGMAANGESNIFLYNRHATSSSNSNSNDLSNSSNTGQSVNAATTTSKTVGMESTGAPLAPLALAIISVLGGIAAVRRK